MTASTLDTRLEGTSSHGSRRTLHIDFRDMFVDVGDSLTDNATVTSEASEETLCGGRHKYHHTGPIGCEIYTFAVGEMITCDVGSHGLQRGFVMKADHPRYKLQLEGGATLTTSHSEAFLTPGSRDLLPTDTTLSTRIVEWQDN